MIAFRTNILAPVDLQTVRFSRDSFITIEDGLIREISIEAPTGAKIVDRSNCVCAPGFVDAHTHLSQYNICGSWEPDLLRWLERRVYPEEMRSASADHAKKTSLRFFHDLLSQGTTTACVWVSSVFSAVDQAFRQAEELGIRALIGRILKDRHAPDELLATVRDNIDQACSLYDKWHGKNPLLDYIFLPRFAVSCSPELLAETARAAGERDARIQTHIGENPSEMEKVHELFPDIDHYTEVYQKAGLLGEKTSLVHAVHMSNEEWGMIADTGTSIVHCPDSNYFLRSGAFHMPDALKRGIATGIGTDVAAGTTLSMWENMRLSMYRQDNMLLSPAGAFYLATTGGARALGLEDVCGSLEPGKSADLAFWLAPEIEDGESALNQLVFLHARQTLKFLYIAGNLVYYSMKQMT